MTLSSYENLINWKDLFDADKKYVKDDTIKLQIKIETENPNALNKRAVQFTSFELIGLSYVV